MSLLHGAGRVTEKAPTSVFPPWTASALRPNHLAWGGFLSPKATVLCKGIPRQCGDTRREAVAKGLERLSLKGSLES